MDKLREQREYIEVHMNSAPEQKNFVVFYQPKYNIANHRPDGSEALVRRYNPETEEYMKPGLFMPLSTKTALNALSTISEQDTHPTIFSKRFRWTK